MSDLSQYFPLTEAAKHLPRRNGKPVSRATLFRWALKGVGGQILATKLVGGVRCVNLSALHDFVARRSAKPTHSRRDCTSKQTNIRRRADDSATRTEAELDMLGICKRQATAKEGR